ncbi:sigma 54-interacting transcriptional regulator [Niallia oryzisoli]|uniref:Sigma 54-interacting transcriptional regulator n=1 Tax=Niallia oryzisoli TaxID=1737571 RepID=A0ABZ2CL16_9BACI
MENYQHLSEYDNVLVADKDGMIIFYELADLYVLREIGLRPEEIIGKHFLKFYQNLSDENSTIMAALKMGTPVCNKRQELITKKGGSFISISSTYPIIENNQVIGAIEFSKHLYNRENIKSIDKIARHKLYRKNNTIYTIDNLITKSPKMEEVKQKIKNVARTNSTVLIHGKTGTGKELVAQSIHNLSESYQGPFISVNCGAIPPNLMESTLFGTVKGSFTGASDSIGLFEQAEGGTLFLDEINSLDYYLQVKILKAIEEKMIRRIGGNRNIYLNIRVIAATNENPETLVAEKRLREDLYYRLAVVQIDLPTLKERIEDIELLTQYYIEFYNNNMNIFVDEVEDQVIECFKRYNWPGNIRELKHAIETTYNNVSTHVITLHDIPKRIKDFNVSPAIGPLKESSQSLKELVESFEKELIIKELDNMNGKMTEASKRLGISKQLLKYKMDKYKLKE